jgi:hypothetical protein
MYKFELKLADKLKKKSPHVLPDRPCKRPLMSFHCPKVLSFQNFSRSPVIIQISNGGAAFLAGKAIKNEKQKAAVLGSIAGAQHVRCLMLSKLFFFT